VGVLLTGVYVSGTSSGEPCALLDLDYLGWAGTGTGDPADEFGLMLQNMVAVGANF
jgi:hypothetical protein